LRYVVLCEHRSSTNRLTAENSPADQGSQELTKEEDEEEAEEEKEKEGILRGRN
jgi:hypothetical protein